VLRNLSWIATLAEKRRKPFIKVNYILTRKNITAVDAMIAFCRKTGVREIRLSPFSFTPHTCALRPTSAQLKLLKSRLRAISKSGLSIDHLWLDVKAGHAVKCYMGWMAVLVGVYGRVKVGCFDSPLPDDGDIYKKSLKEIWVSGQARLNRLQLRDSLSKLDFCAPCGGLSKANTTVCPFTADNIRINEMIRK
jgi:MoaA/NifB/PqqE/SkfB family radical SAM enzyme